MNGTARLAAALVLVVLSAAPAFAQAAIQPTAQPIVTAESAPWHIRGEPLMYQGNFYYPAGPQIHFNQNEMVRSGSYEGVPLYIRTTIEPNSIVFVPLAGGLMQPYERRRSGDLAGTVGSSAPSFPVSISPQPTSSLGGSAQSAGPPLLTAPAIESPVTSLEGTVRAPASPVQVAQSPAPVVGTSGAVVRRPRTADASASRRVSRSVFISFDNRRWYNSGAATALDTTRFSRIGEYHGLPVYTRRGGPSSTIYVPVALDVPDMITPYSRSR